MVIKFINNIVIFFMLPGFLMNMGGGQNNCNTYFSVVLGPNFRGAKVSE